MVGLLFLRLPTRRDILLRSSDIVGERRRRPRAELESCRGPVRDARLADASCLNWWWSLLVQAEVLPGRSETA